MKIKTITCHKVYNVGASLQAYALVRYLKDLGHDVEIIDYEPEYLSRSYRLNVVNNPKYKRLFVRQLYLLVKLPGRLKARKSQRKRNFDAFEQTYLPLTEKTYQTNNELQKNPPMANVYLAGSDQIWNTIFQNGRDPAFYLDFAPVESIRASYAASFATEDVLEEWKTSVKHWLEGLDFISVRESSGVNIIKKLGIHGAVQVMDPVFLLDKSIWEEFCVEPAFKEPYLFVYDFDNNEEINTFILKMAREKKLKIYSMFQKKVADRCFEQAGPLEFLGLIRNAEYVVSNSFHATAFALIFEKPFAVFERIEQINTRMRDLLDLLDLKMINNSIEYSKVHINLENKVEFSKQYLKSILSAVRD